MGSVVWEIGFRVKSLGLTWRPMGTSNYLQLGLQPYIYPIAPNISRVVEAVTKSHEPPSCVKGLRLRGQGSASMAFSRNHEG